MSKWGVFALLVGLLAASNAPAMPPRPANPLPPLDPEAYEIIHVSTAQELADAAWNLRSKQAIVIAPGKYHLANVRFPNGVDGRITIGRFGAKPIRNVQIRGETGDRDDVVLLGAGMLDERVPYGVQIFTASEVTLADFSVGEVYYHAIGIEGTQGARKVLIHNVRAFDAGQQIIKGSGKGADDVVIQHSLIEYSNGAIEHPEASKPNTCYTNGIDVTGGHRWEIRDSVIRRIYCQNHELAGPAILVWKGARDTVVERNLIFDSSRGISLGLVQGSDHSGGLIRGNLVCWNEEAKYAVDAPIYTTSPKVKIVNNTVFTSGRYGNSVEVRFKTAKRVEVIHNQLDAAIKVRDGATAALSDNEVLNVTSTEIQKICNLYR